MSTDPYYGPPLDIAPPARVAALPVDDHGRPVPWFAATIDGTIDLRIADQAKMSRAITERRCWICGQRFEKSGAHLRAFIVGPLALFSRAAPEPPSHTDCALYALRTCPFLAKPNKGRRTAQLPDRIVFADDGQLANPGVNFAWRCRRYDVEYRPDGTVLFLLPMPASLTAYHEGLPALRADLDEAVDAAEARARQSMAASGVEPATIDHEIMRGRRLLDRLR